MVVLSLSLDGKLVTKLEHDIIYRIGRKEDLEIYCDDKSVEFAHATIALLAGEVVRLASVAGPVFVNGQQTEITNICNTHAANGIVDVRFGNVIGKLHFEDCKNVETAHDSSGVKNRFANITRDSLTVPETEPASGNTTCNEDSFNIPETQAVYSTKPSRVHDESKVSLGDDVLIPETQDIFAHIQNPVMAQDDQVMTNGEDDASGFGTQIRICTQEFNESYGEAIDDFDSSLLLAEIAIKTTVDNNASDPDMSALNWSESHLKCTPLNSTNSDNQTARNQICVTPDFLVANEGSNIINGVSCTPDLFELLDVVPNENVSTSKNEIKESMISYTPENISLGNVPVGIETPEPTQSTQGEDIAEDFIATQLFPRQIMPPEKSAPMDINDTQDLIATQLFVRDKHLQAVSPNQNIEDFIETQAFPKRYSFLEPTNSNPNKDNSQDFIATQIFKRPSETPALKSRESSNISFHTSALIHNASEDMVETQLFVPSKSLNNNLDNSKEADRLNISDCLNINDELDKDIQQLIALSDMPCSQTDNDGFVKCVESKPKTDTNDDEQCQPKQPLKRSRVRRVSEVKEKIGTSAIATRSRAKRQYPSSSLETTPHPLKRTRSESTSVDSENKNDSSTKEGDTIERTPDSQVKSPLKTTKVKVLLCDINKKSKSQGDAPTCETKTQKLSSKKKLTDSLDQAAEEPTTSSNARSSHDQLKDINNYIKGIKSTKSTIKLVLSMCNNLELKPILKVLRNTMEVVENPVDCDLVIMDKGERTFKFLVGVALNKPILSSRWLYAIKETRSIIVKSEHIFKDEKFEQVFKFDPLLVLEKPSLLKDLHFMLGKDIMPKAEDMNVIIQSAGGTVHRKVPPSTKNICVYIVTSNQDKQIKQLFRNLTNAKYIKTENVMQALVQHKTELLDDLKVSKV